VEYKQVLDTFIRHTDKLVDLFVDGEVISTTGEHPFWTPDKGWVEAKDLVVGSLFMTEDGRVIDIDGVETRSGDFTVYNFSVEGFHTYFVSDLSILVHNARNYLEPDPNAQGPHIVFKLDNETKQIRSYQEFIPNTPYLPDGSINLLYNPKYPKPWIPKPRVDKFGAPHNGVPTPHVNDRSIPGGARPADPHEIPPDTAYP
jgi:hypothetical protein